VTGGAGFIGSHLVDALIGRGHQVRVLDVLEAQVHGAHAANTPGFRPEYLHLDAELLVGDVADRALLERALDGVQVVYHQAAAVGVGQSMYEIERYVQRNTGATAVLLDVLANQRNRFPVERLVVASSMSIYGEGRYTLPDGTPYAPKLRPDAQLARHDWEMRGPNGESAQPTPTDEAKPLISTSVYALSKKDQEEYCLVVGGAYNIPTVALRYFNCYDDQTEVLTADGFKLFRELSTEDEIATLNPQTHYLEYHKARAWQVFRYQGDLYRFASRSYDLCVTSEHRMYVKPTKKRPYGFIEAAALAAAPTAYQMRVKCCADGWAGQDVPFHIIPEFIDTIGRVRRAEKRIPMELWCEFLGWYIAEGCRFVTSSQVHTVVISQHRSVNPENHARIVALFHEMGFRPYVTPDGRDIKVCSKQLYTELQRLGFTGSLTRRIPAEVKRLDRKYLLRLYESLMCGDGDKSGRRYTTASKRLADDFAELCLKIGKSVTCQMETQGKNRLFRLSISDANEPQLGDNRTKTTYVERVPYDGLVYDVTVPNHILFVRRNGRSCWSSNCYGTRQALSNPYTGVCAIFGSRLLNGKPPLVFEDGKQSRDFVHVSDIVQANLLVGLDAEAGAIAGEVFNVGTGRALNLLEVAKVLADGLGVGHITPEIAGRFRSGDIRHCVADIGKIKNRLGYTPKVRFEEGMGELTAWMKTQQADDRVEAATAELARKGLTR